MSDERSEGLCLDLGVCRPGEAILVRCTSPILDIGFDRAKELDWVRFDNDRLDDHLTSSVFLGEYDCELQLVSVDLALGRVRAGQVVRAQKTACGQEEACLGGEVLDVHAVVVAECLKTSQYRCQIHCGVVEPFEGACAHHLHKVSEELILLDLQLLLDGK